MTHYFIVPGYGGSGPEHWQTWFEQQGPNFHRIQQTDWDQPNLDEWADNVEKALCGYNPDSVVLVGHSFGCLTIANWARTYRRKVRAALLVAPPDPQVINERIPGKPISSVPEHRLRFRSLLVASTTDPWAGIEKSGELAESWGSRFINIGDAGHINAQSGHYQWKQGLELLYQL